MNWPELVQTALERLASLTAGHTSNWGLGAESEWNFSQDDGRLHWDFADGRRITAAAEIAGTFDTAGENWLWSWANSTVDSTLSGGACIAREYGEIHDLDPLIEPRANCLLEECWELAAVTMFLGGFEGVYKGPDGQNEVFFVFKKPTREVRNSS